MDNYTMPTFNDSFEVKRHPQAMLLGFDLIEAFFNKNLTDLEVSMLEKGIDALLTSGSLRTKTLQFLDEQEKGRLLLCAVLSRTPPESMNHFFAILSNVPTGAVNRLFILLKSYRKPPIKMLALSALLSDDKTLIEQYLSEISKKDMQFLVMEHKCLLLKELSRRGRLTGIEKILDYPLNDSEKIKHLLEPADFQNCIASAVSYGHVQAKLIEIFLEKEPTSITDFFFRNCASLTALILSQSITHIGKRAFMGCTSLTTLILPQGITYLGEQTFWGCTSLTALTLPQSVTHIGKGAFAHCRNLTVLTLPKSLTHITERAFAHCNSLRTLILPQSITHIGKQAFENCRSLTALTLPQGITHIGERAFSYCRNLTAQTLPQSTTHIGEGAFEDCSSLTTLILPQGITHIADRAFWGCTRLTQIIINTSSDKEIMRVQAILPEEYRDKVIKNSVYNCVISFQKKRYALASSLLKLSPIYSQKADRINQLPDVLFGAIDKFDERGYFIFQNNIKGLEIPTTKEGLEIYKKNLSSLIRTFITPIQVEPTITKAYATCINKLQQYKASIYSKKVKKEKIHPGFFTENQVLSLEVECKSVAIEKVIAYLQGDTVI